MMERKTSSEKHRLRDFITIRLVLKEILKRVLHTVRKGH
jgi:hypothetical protein